MIVRLLLLGGILYLFFTVRRLFREARRTGHLYDDGPARIDDVMVQDPVCGTYIPKKDGIRVVAGGREVYFCSEDCRRKFLEEN